MPKLPEEAARSPPKPPGSPRGGHSTRLHFHTRAALKCFRLDFYLDGRPGEDQDDSRAPQADLDHIVPLLRGKGDSSQRPSCFPRGKRRLFPLAKDQASLGSKVRVRVKGGPAGNSG